MKRIVFIAIFLCSALCAFSQTSLPSGYRGITLGMTLDQVKSALLRDAEFGYRGDRDVSMLPDGDRNLIETKGNGYLADCWFQFTEGKLYTITININTARMDYYSVFSTLCDKYGNPGELTPERCSWNGSSVIMTLEKPLCIKYMDVNLSSQLADKAQTEAASEEKARKDFLDSL
ncbi:MAG: hypothetical protein KBT02_10580 [Treponema sp.]|nr:hypothetical protein [Candidatus Treponema caballi]